MTLPIVEVNVPTDRLPPETGGREAKVPVEAKLLPSVSPVRFMPGGEIIVSISEEVAAELEVGDVIAVPPARGELQPVEVLGEAGPIGQDPDMWVRVKPARDKKTLSHELADANARDAEMKRRMQHAAGKRMHKAVEELERGRELLHAAGFPNLSEVITWGTDAASALGKDVDAMSAADELETAMT